MIDVHAETERIHSLSVVPPAFAAAVVWERGPSAVHPPDGLPAMPATDADHRGERGTIPERANRQCLPPQLTDKKHLCQTGAEGQREDLEDVKFRPAF